MSDVMKPCPNRECRGSEPMVDQHPQILTTTAVRVVCIGCQTSGPLCRTEVEARRLWGALPRDDGPPLRWTAEPPKGPGWYWVAPADGISYMHKFTAADFDNGTAEAWVPRNGRVAGPIPEPIGDDE